jgi:hypothetical protein
VQTKGTRVLDVLEAFGSTCVSVSVALTSLIALLIFLAVYELGDLVRDGGVYGWPARELGIVALAVGSVRAVTVVSMLTIFMGCSLLHRLVRMCSLFVMSFTLLFIAVLMVTVDSSVRDESMQEVR